jgi:hypothetical protein
MQQGRHSRSPKAAALFGALLLLPFVAANAIVGYRLEPFSSFIRPGLNTSRFEYGLLAFVLGCMPVGAFIAARPLFDKRAHPTRRVYLAERRSLGGTYPARNH